MTQLPRRVQRELEFSARIEKGAVEDKKKAEARAQEAESRLEALLKAIRELAQDDHTPIYMAGMLEMIHDTHTPDPRNMLRL